MARVASNAKPTMAELQYLCDPVDGKYENVFEYQNEKLKNMFPINKKEK